MRFRDREEAALLLAARLRDDRGRHPLVLGVPRGAVPMAGIVARELEGDLDVVLVHKLGAPFNAELALGAVDEHGTIFVSDAAEQLGVRPGDVHEEALRQLAELRRRRALYSPGGPLVVTGRRVIVVDDGVATGATLIAALRATRALDPAELTAAVAVAPRETADRLREECDRLVVLEIPPRFHAVGQFFDDFRQVSDDEVVETLHCWHEARGARPDSKT